VTFSLRQHQNNGGLFHFVQGFLEVGLDTSPPDTCPFQESPGGSRQSATYPFTAHNWTKKITGF